LPALHKPWIQYSPSCIQRNLTRMIFHLDSERYVRYHLP
jgi:hypothetical protein